MILWITRNFAIGFTKYVTDVSGYGAYCSIYNIFGLKIRITKQIIPEYYPEPLKVYNVLTDVQEIITCQPRTLNRIDFGFVITGVEK